MKTLRFTMETAAVLLGVSPAIRALGEDVELAVRSDATVLIAGESGTRKEGLARLIHARSSRSRDAFTVVDCSSLGHSPLASSYLAGEQCSISRSATVFLDEIDGMDRLAQEELLRFLDAGRRGRVRADSGSTHDARIIAATRHCLIERVRERAFEPDLYYRLNVLHLRVPPLRERRDDILPLLGHFFGLLSLTHLRCAPELESDTYAALLEYSWPGNIRELKSVAERLLLFPHTRPIRPMDLSAHIVDSRNERIEMDDTGVRTAAWNEHALRDPATP